MTFGTFLCRIWSFFTEFAQDSEKWNHCQFRKFVGIFTKTYSSEAFKSMVFNLFSTWSVILLKFYNKNYIFRQNVKTFVGLFSRDLWLTGINTTSITQPFNKNGDFVGIFQTSFVLNLQNILETLMKIPDLNRPESSESKSKKIWNVS